MFFCQGILAQTTVEDNRTLEWADYYFMNQEYEKALSHYSNLGASIPLRSRRNFSKIYAHNGQLQKAAQILRPLVDSDSAEVKDYYYFASYLTNNDKLRDEYRQKAIRLPIEEYPQSPKDNHPNSYTFQPLSLNTEGSEFGAHLIEKNNAKYIIYSQKQSKDSKNILKPRQLDQVIQLSVKKYMVEYFLKIKLFVFRQFMDCRLI